MISNWMFYYVTTLLWQVRVQSMCLCDMSAVQQQTDKCWFMLFYFLFSNCESWWQASWLFSTNILSADILSMNSLLTGN